MECKEVTQYTDFEKLLKQANDTLVVVMFHGKKDS